MADIAVVPIQIIGGLPWFIWAMAALGFGLVMVIGGFILYWYMMGPCRAYFRAQMRGDDITLLGQKSGRLQFRGADYVTGVLNNIDLPLSWIQRSNESYRFGKCMAKVVHDSYGICSEPTILQGIKETVYNWNELELNRMSYYHQQGQEYEPDLITCYDDLYKKVTSGDIEDPVAIHSVFEVPLNDIQQYLAHIGPGDLEGHISVRVAEEMESADSEAWPSWMKAFIMIEIAVVVMVIAAYILRGGG